MKTQTLMEALTERNLQMIEGRLASLGYTPECFPCGCRQGVTVKGFDSSVYAIPPTTMLVCDRHQQEFGLPRKVETSPGITWVETDRVIEWFQVKKKLRGLFV